MRVAVTGGTGFVGAALIDRLLMDGHSVAALARDPARLRRSREVDVVTGDLDREESLAALSAGADALIHLAGVTHARRDADYQRVNVDGAARAATAAAKAGARLIHASSMSARAPLTSPYAQSKYDSEAAVASAGGRFIALRLPAIYGPGDHATLPYFRLVKSGLALEPRTPSPARASIIHVDDAAGALAAAMTQDAVDGVCEVGDDRREGRAWSEIGAVLSETFGNTARAVRVPRFAVAALHDATRFVEMVAGRAPSVRKGQVNEFFHADWVARDRLFNDAANWAPAVPLAEGFAKTVRWYQEQGLL